MQAHTDIVATGWVTRLPRSWLPYLLLARVDRPIGTWLLFLPGLWGILLAGPPPAEAIRLILLFGIGSLVMRAAGCVVNDLWDRDIDRMVARTAGRPLASGMLRPRHALVFLGVLLLAGLAILLQLNGLAQALGVASLLLVALYPLAKRVTWWPQLVMGFTFGFGAPLGHAAGAGHLSVAWAVLYGAAILWDLGFDTIYAHQDREDDALVGVKSTARLFGDQTAPFLAACYTGTGIIAGAGRLAGRASAPGSIQPWHCRQCCSGGRLWRWISTIRRCASGFSGRTARPGWPSPWQYWWAGSEGYSDAHGM